MRVLVVSNMDSSAPFGQFTRPFHLGAGLAELGHEVGHVAVDPSKVTYGPTWRSESRAFGPLSRTLAEAMRSFRPDVLYAHQNLPGAVSVTAAGGTRTVADFHSIPSLEWLNVARASTGRTRVSAGMAALKALASERFIARRSNGVIAAGGEVARLLSSRDRRLKPKVVPNGVDRRLLKYKPSADSPFEPTGRFHVLAVLPVAAMVQNSMALRLLSNVAQRLNGSNAAFHVVGAPEANSRSPNLQCHGFVESLDDWISHADLCLLPYPKEAALYGGAKNKLLEYLALGKEVLSTPEGIWGMPEAIKWPGVHVTQSSVEALAAAIGEAAAGRTSRLCDSKQRIEAAYTWQSLALQVSGVLQDL